MKIKTKFFTITAIILVAMLLCTACTSMKSSDKSAGAEAKEPRHPYRIAVVAPTESDAVGDDASTGDGSVSFYLPTENGGSDASDESENTTEEPTSPETAANILTKSVETIREKKARLEEGREMHRRMALLKKLTDCGRQGTKGRLVFEELDYSVAVYEAFEGYNAACQQIVDAEDSAAWMLWLDSKSPIIADHSNQGFDIIKKSQIGDTCYIVNGESYQKYQCILVDNNGINERTDMYLSDGYNFMRANDPGRLYMYTCNDGWYHITVVVWEPVNDIEFPVYEPIAIDQYLF